MDSLEALNRIKVTAKQLEESARLLGQAALAVEEGSLAADWLALQSVLGHGRVFFFNVSPGGVIDGVLGGLTETLGWRDEEFRGRRLDDVLDPSVECAESPSAWLSRQESPKRFRQPLAFLHRSGWRVWLEVTMVACEGGAGYRAMASDINEHRLRVVELERQLTPPPKEEVEPVVMRPVEPHPEAEGDLWHVMARRQLGIALSALSRLSRLLRVDPRPEELGRLDGLVQWLLQLSHFQHEPEGWRQTSDFSPRAEVELVAALFRPVGDSQGLGGKIEVQPGLPERIQGQAAALRAALLDVFEWASLALPNGGLQVDLSASEDLTLRVLFKCYGLAATAEESTQALATCRKFLKVMGGRLRVDRFPEGVEVQLFFQCQPHETRRPPRESPAPGEGLSILLAEDDEISRKVAVRAIKNLGHQVHSVATGLEVLQAMTDQDYDVVLLDVQMPDMDGIEAARQLRKRFFPCPYLIALTAGNTAADRRKVMEAGMHDFLAKPLKANELRDALCQVPLYSAAGGEGAAPGSA